MNFKSVTSRSEAHQELNAFRRKQDTALVIKGDALEICLDYYEHEFMDLATACPAVVCCRCSPGMLVFSLSFLFNRDIILKLRIYFFKRAVD